MSGVARSASPMPAREMTRIFIFLGGAACPHSYKKVWAGGTPSFPIYNREIFSSNAVVDLPGTSGKNHNFSARQFDHAAFLLVQCVQSVIAAFDINIRPGR